jgi:rhomboid protease GluP
MCAQCRAFITTDDKVCPYCEAPVGARAIDRRDPGALIGGLIPAFHFTTFIILTINAGLYLATVMFSINTGRGGGWMDLDSETLFIFGAKWRAAILAGEYWRLVTAGFLHGGAIHIMMNSWVLFDLGAQVEEALGTSRLLIIYFISTITGFGASMYWSDSLSVGASAGLFGLIGAMIAYGMQSKSAMSSAIRQHYTRWAMYGMAMGFLGVFAIDNGAHIGGLAGGFGVAYLMGSPSLLPHSPKERLIRLAAGVSLALTAVAFGQLAISFMKSAG